MLLNIQSAFVGTSQLQSTFHPIFNDVGNCVINIFN